MTTYPHALPSILKTPSTIILADLVLFARREGFEKSECKDFAECILRTDADAVQSGELLNRSLAIRSVLLSGCSEIGLWYAVVATPGAAGHLFLPGQLLNRLLITNSNSGEDPVSDS